MEIQRRFLTDRQASIEDLLCGKPWRKSWEEKEAEKHIKSMEDGPCRETG